MDENTAATECVYCGNTAIITERFEGKFEPKRVIPFKTTKEEAIEAFSSYKKGKVFMPKDFLNKNNIEKVSGVYIPFFLYDMIVDGSLDVEAIKEQRWSEGDYKYVKKDYYNVIREGNMIFEKIPTDASKKFSDDIMDSIEPFNYEDLKTFNSSYMSGFLAEKYDLDADDLLSRAEGRAKQTTQDILFADIKGYNSKRIDEFNGRVSINGVPEYVMLPVWMMTTKYQGESYTFAINGQTGKMVGSLPIDKGLYGKFLGLGILIPMLVMQFLMYFSGGFSGKGEVIALIVSLLIGWIYTSHLKAGMNTVAMKTGAGSYMRENSVRTRHPEDVFLFTKTERRQKTTTPPGNPPAKP